MAYFFILAGVILRLLPHLPNFAPISAIALFGGTYLNKKIAIAVPLAVMLISDIFLGFHNTMPFVYGSFLLIGLLGIYLKNHKTIPNVAGASLISSVLFYIITNFGVWAVTPLYPKTAVGLGQSYLMAIPFFRNTFLSDLFYVTIMFATYELIIWLYYKGGVKWFRQFQKKNLRRKFSSQRVRS